MPMTTYVIPLHTYDVLHDSITKDKLCAFVRANDLDPHKISIEVNPVIEVERDGETATLTVRQIPLDEHGRVVYDVSLASTLVTVPLKSWPSEHGVEMFILS